jgi:hypothetical protein
MEAVKKVGFFTWVVGAIGMVFSLKWILERKK